MTPTPKQKIIVDATTLNFCADEVCYSKTPNNNYHCSTLARSLIALAPLPLLISLSYFFFFSVLFAKYTFPHICPPLYLRLRLFPLTERASPLAIWLHDLSNARTEDLWASACGVKKKN